MFRLTLALLALVAAGTTVGALRPATPRLLAPLELHALERPAVVAIPPEGPCRDIVWATCALDLRIDAGVMAARGP
jgi:hypothetical protein